jgi:hypothetical protein
MNLSAIVAFNAKACEEAIRPRCVCPCGGRLHGKAHSRAWVEATTAKLELERYGATQEGLELEERPCLAGDPGRCPQHGDRHKW